jgi:quercetin dioxygenase-like cupin family protein
MVKYNDAHCQAKICRMKLTTLTTFTKRFLGAVALSAALTAVVAAVLAAASAQVAHAQAGQKRLDGNATLALSDIPWPSANVGGVGTSGSSAVQTVVLKGDPTKPGLYVLALRIAPNTTIQAHSHGDDRVATVLKGTWYFGYGQKFDQATLKALAPGSMYTEPGNVAHFAQTRDEVIVQITGYGPSSTTYVNPADDPARK